MKMRVTPSRWTGCNLHASLKLMAAKPNFTWGPIPSDTHKKNTEYAWPSMWPQLSLLYRKVEPLSKWLWEHHITFLYILFHYFSASAIPTPFFIFNSVLKIAQSIECPVYKKIFTRGYPSIYFRLSSLLVPVSVVHCIQCRDLAYCWPSVIKTSLNRATKPSYLIEYTSTVIIQNWLC